MYSKFAVPNYKIKKRNVGFNKTHKGVIMNQVEIEELKERIEKATKEEQKAKWELERIEKEWKEKYGCDSLTEVVALLEEKENSQENINQQISDLSTKVNEILETNDA